MSKSAPKTPEADVPPRGPVTFTSPPMLGTSDVWVTVQSLVDAVPAEEVQRPRVDLQVAAESALEVCDDVRGDATLYARFLAMASVGEFEPDAFRKLQRLAGAAWYARRMQLRAESTDTEATVPPALVTEGDAIVDRMLPVVTYYLGKSAEVAPVLAAISVASGHRRLANNLHNLADLYQSHRAVIEGDPVNYRAGDERDARRTASAIITALSDSSTREAELWGGRCARVWTLLSGSYARVQATGQYLLRETPDAAKERFPSLIAEARTAAQPRKAPEPAAPVADPANVAAPAKPAGPIADAPAVASPIVAEPATPRAGTAPAAPKRSRKR